jgi:hypothetical protein
MVVLSDGFKNRKCAHGIVLQKHVWVSDASVNVGFRRNVHNRIHLMNEPVHKMRVADIALYESVAFIILDVMQVRRVSPHTHFVNVYQFTVWVFCKHEPAEVASNKS